jgi:hypothetical protein
MEGYLLSRGRDHPAVALAPAVDRATPTLAPDGVRAIVGAGPRLYVFAGEELLDLQCLPGELALAWGSSARIWQPGLSSESDPGDHPLVRPLGDESVMDVFAREFDLSRPRVRREIKRIEGIRAFTELQLDKAIRELEDRQILARPPALPRAALSSAATRQSSG